MKKYNDLYNNEKYNILSDVIKYHFDLYNWSYDDFLTLMVKIQDEALWNCDEGHKPHYNQRETWLISQCVYRVYSDFMSLFGDSPLL